jgi:hypothetical protein
MNAFFTLRIKKQKHYQEILSIKGSQKSAPGQKNYSAASTAMQVVVTISQDYQAESG